MSIELHHAPIFLTSTTTMKQRITYVVTDPDSFNPDQIEIQKGSKGKGDTYVLTRVKAAKEHRITLGLDELAQAPIDT